MSTLITRGITGLIFVVVMIAGVVSGPYPFFALFTLIAALCLWEFFTIVLNPEEPAYLLRRILGLVYGIIPVAGGFCLKTGLIPLHDWPIMTYTLVLLFFVSILVEIFAAAKDPFQNIGYYGVGLLYLGIPFHLVSLAAYPSGEYSWQIVLGMLILVWANDSFAYLVGSWIGKTPLFPRISPKKTWEGTIGGGLITLAVAALLARWWTVLSLPDWLALAAIAVVFGTLGDLAESMLKRSRQIKDSGNLLPGHGGMLDRFDAFIFMLPFAVTYISFAVN